MSFARINHSNIYYEFEKIRTDNERLLLLHDLGDNSRIWDFLTKSLDISSDIIRTDLPGHGKSIPFKSPFSIRETAEVIQRFLEEISLSGVYLCGLSMGAAIALQLAIDFPERIKGLILISSWSFCDEDLKVRLQDYINIVQAHGVEKLVDRLILPRYLAKDFVSSNPRVVRNYKEIKMQQSKEAYVSSCHACMEFDIRKRLSEIKIPILLIVGEHDILTPPYHSKIILENTESSQLFILPNCGHVPCIEKPDESAAQVIGFCS